jgi:hypothetical protein
VRWSTQHHRINVAAMTTMALANIWTAVRKAVPKTIEAMITVTIIAMIRVLTIVATIIAVVAHRRISATFAARSRSIAKSSAAASRFRPMFTL